jgi:hypothetical protein
MKPAALVGAFALMAAMCTAQVAPPSHSQMGGGDSHAGQGFMSSRTDFGRACGIQDTSMESAVAVKRSAQGEWALNAGGSPAAPDTAMARVWRESNWMVDIHGALGQGMATMHTGQMCFDPQGRITHLIDRYMEMANCGCVRFTLLLFGPDGRVMRRQQRFIKIATGSEIAAPEVAKEFPDVWDFRRVEQLPFYPLVK